MKVITLLIIIVAIVLISVIGVTYTGNMVGTVPNEKLDEIAKCITKRGAVLYITSNCGSCDEQKKEFGNSFRFLNYVDCSEHEDLCLIAGIEGYPTWRVNNVNYPGVRSPGEMAYITGCQF